MAQFFSYPYNYNQNFSGTKSGPTAARKVSNKNLYDFTEKSSILFEFDLEDNDPGFDIDAIQVVGENIKEVEIGDKPAISLDKFKFLVGRGGTFYTIERSDRKYWICGLDSTGRLISRIVKIDSFSSNLRGFASDGSFFYLIGGSTLYRINPISGKEEDLGGSLSSAKAIAFYDGRLYMVDGRKLLTLKSIPDSNGSTTTTTDTTSLGDLVRSDIKDLTNFKNKLYILTDDSIIRIDSTLPDEGGNIKTTEITDNLGANSPKGLASTSKNLYINENDQIYKIENGSTMEQLSNGKQYLFSNESPPVSIKPSRNSVTVKFIPKDGTAKIYQVLLLKKRTRLIRYSSPTPGFGRPDTDNHGDVIQPSDFSQIDPTQIEQGVIVHQNTQGQRIKRRAYASQPKYQVSYNLPIRTLKQMQALQKFRENNLNFTFAQNIVLYPDRIYPAHFSSFDLPINYISKALTQDGMYTCRFTVTQN